MRARAKKDLESATEYGKVDAGRAARGKVFILRFRLTVVILGCRKISRARGVSKRQVTWTGVHYDERNYQLTTDGTDFTDTVHRDKACHACIHVICEIRGWLRENLSTGLLGPPNRVFRFRGIEENGELTS